MIYLQDWQMHKEIFWKILS